MAGSPDSGRTHDSARAGLVLGALGVVFGDIGTSPIYALATVFNPADPHPVPVSAENVFGVVSLVFWSVMIIVTVTYVLLAMRADNGGEGGIMALITLVRQRGTTVRGRGTPDGRQDPPDRQGTPDGRQDPPDRRGSPDGRRDPPDRRVARVSRGGTRNGRRVVAVLSALGLFGAALFFGDSMITPAISVLSAVEGLKVVQPSLAPLVVPAVVVILLGLFLVQRRGTAQVGRIFGPVMLAWFLAIGACGLAQIVAHPGVLRALSPTYALGFAVRHPGIAFFALAAVVLAVTGAEALYADMGHFGRRPITRAWLGLVLPALVLSYLGQGALIVADPAAVSSPFFLLAPGWARIPLVVLATAATVIAAQAVITGAYSVASQAAELGYLPRLRIRHTSAARFGQIYVPWINWFLLVSVLTLVLVFRSSTALAYAYGTAVTGTITITTLLFFVVAGRRWRTPRWLLVAGAIVLLTVDLLFFAANLTKLAHGAWLPLLIGLAVFTVMVTWQRGREIVTAERQRREGSLLDFVDYLRAHDAELVRAPGTAVFLNRGKRTAPLALRANVTHNHVRHEHVVILSIDTEPVPRVRAQRRVIIDDLGFTDDGITHLTLRTGYMQSVNVPAMLAALPANVTEGRLDADQVSYFLSKVDLSPGPERTMARWRKRLFLTTAHLTADAAEHFGLPPDRTVVMGSKIDV